MSENTNDAKTRFEKSSSLEDWSGYVLLGGLMLETAILFAYPDGKSLLHISLEAVAYLLVFGGVFGEIMFAAEARKASDELSRAAELQIAELAKQTAEANERAAQAQLALERYKAPRQISASQRADIITAIRQFAGTQVNLWASPDLPESQNLVIALGAALEAAGWQVTQTRIISGYTSSAGGILITCTTRPDAVAAGRALAEALGKVGLFASCAPILGEGPPDGPPRLFAAVQPKPLDEVEKVITEASKNAVTT